MDDQEQALTDEYLALLGQTGLDAKWPAIEFDAGHYGGEHVAFNRDGSTSLIRSDRGQEYETERFKDRRKLLAALCRGATWEVAKYDIQAPPDTHTHEQQEMIHERQVELLRRIDPQWADETKISWRKWCKVRDRMHARNIKREKETKFSIFLVYAFSILIVALAIYITQFAG